MLIKFNGDNIKKIITDYTNKKVNDFGNKKIKELELKDKLKKRYKPNQYTMKYDAKKKTLIISKKGVK